MSELWMRALFSVTLTMLAALNAGLGAALLDPYPFVAALSFSAGAIALGTALWHAYKMISLWWAP
ncbi:MAG: hypothetical protein IPM64_17640 [Phycisphaerales bacterium]|nr:hypothetical protein [Phycisphaerales bacterium]